jgi:transcriptional regulator with XRE-family HTH domain
MKKKILFLEVNMLTPLRRERVLRQMSLYDIRARTGISVSKLSLVERGIERPSEDEKRRLAKALGVQIHELFPKKETS